MKQFIDQTTNQWISRSINSLRHRREVSLCSDQIINPVADRQEMNQQLVLINVLLLLKTLDGPNVQSSFLKLCLSAFEPCMMLLCVSGQSGTGSVSWSAGSIGCCRWFWPCSAWPWSGPSAPSSAPGPSCPCSLSSSSWLSESTTTCTSRWDSYSYISYISYSYISYITVTITDA